MKKISCCFVLLFVAWGCERGNSHLQPTPANKNQNTQQNKDVAVENDPAHHFELLASEKAEKVSEGVFLVGRIRASLSDNDSEVQIIPVEMDEPYIYWVQWGLEKQDVNFDGYVDIGVTRHGGAKWGKYFWWLYDPEIKQFYTNTLTEELSELTFANFWTFPETKEIKIRDYYGTEATDYIYKIVNGHLHQVRLEGLRVEMAKYWQKRGYNFDPNEMTAYQMDWKVKDIEMATYWRKRGYNFDPNLMNASQMRSKVMEAEDAK